MFCNLARIKFSLSLGNIIEIKIIDISSTL